MRVAGEGAPSKVQGRVASSCQTTTTTAGAVRHSHPRKTAWGTRHPFARRDGLGGLLAAAVRLAMMTVSRPSAAGSSPIGWRRRLARAA